MERRSVQLKRGLLTDADIRKLITEQLDGRRESELDQATVDREIQMMARKMDKYNVPPQGDIPTQRDDGSFRILVCQMGGCAGREIREQKIATTERLINKFEVNLAAFMELNYNWSTVSSSANLSSWFLHEEREIRSTTAHNIHETTSRHQPGGTGMVCRHEFLQYARKPAHDFRGLGRWCSWPFFCNPTHTTRIVVAYRTGSCKSKGLRTVYQQQVRYMQLHNISGSPQQLFDKDLLQQCKRWRQSGERILLLMDANEHVLTGKFNRGISKMGLDLEEFTHKCWGQQPPHTHINGSLPIDGGYKSPEIEALHVCLLPFLESPGDHRAFLIDISTRSFLGEYRYKVCRPVSRRLIMSQQGSVDEYNRIVREQFGRHRIPERLDAVDKMTRYCGFPTPNFLRAMIIKLYKQMTEIRVHAEKKCRKIKRPECDYSPTIQMWYDRVHAYLQLIRLKEGKAHNTGNILRFAKRTNIQSPDKLTLEELKDGLRYCKIRKAELRKQAKGLRKVHLRDCLIDAQTRKQHGRVRAIKQTIHREESKRMWHLIKRTVKNPHSPSVLKVQRIIGGDTREYHTQEDVEYAIQRECEIRFSLAHSAPIMSNLLGHKLRYLGDADLANSIINGSYNIPADLDPATTLILKEIGKMGREIIQGNGTEIIITPDDLIQFWKHVGEFTSSSSSGVHYGHYKAAIQDETIVAILAQQLTVIARSGVPPDSWSVGLQVLLEKIAGVCLVEKLRAIQLYEADFNCFNHFIFGKKAMGSLTRHGFLPEELFSQKGCTVEDAKFDKTLMADLSRQARHPMTVVSADAAYCYDRVNHIVMSLVWLALTGNTAAIVAVLICLQTMRFFQRTGFGDSKTFFGGPNHTPYMMGLGQGNRAAPPSWIQLSAVLVNVYKQLDLGTDLRDPITDARIHSMGAMFVDDLDLYTWKDDITDPHELVLQSQREVSQWCLLLNATGGALKPEKCFWYLLDYSCKGGEWSYSVHTDFELSVINPDGSPSVIQQEAVTSSKKTLGIHDSPSGGNHGHLEFLHNKLTTWIARMKNGHLPAHMAWVAYRLQLWPGLRYGLGTMTNDLEVTETIFAKADYKTMPILGVARTVKRELRNLHPTFGGFGLFHLPTEQLICRINMLLQHYHTANSLSKKLDASFRLLQLQLGTPGNPLTLSYDKWGYLAPLSWVKMLWRSLDTFNIRLHMEFRCIPLPRERDQVLMELILDSGLSKEDIKSLSRCRGMLQCIFLSDMVTADGKYLESFVFEPGPFKRRSTYRFPPEGPTRRDWDTWFTFWHNYASVGGKLRIPLGRWIHPTHRKWIWFSPAINELQRIEDGVVYRYRPVHSMQRTRSGRAYALAWSEPLETSHAIGHPVSVHGLDTSLVYKLAPGPSLANEPTAPNDFWSYLHAWGGEWMWEGIEDSQRTKHDLTWLIQGMRTGSLTWVTDGSYDRKRAPVISGVGWIIFCTNTGNRLVGSFWERSLSASSYRAELLGLCSLHLLALALSEFYKITQWTATICCDNLRALRLSSHECRRIRPSAACSDIHRSLRSTKAMLPGRFHYQHVSGHMDRILLWHQLSLVQQLNCVCDTTAKAAVHRALTTGYISVPTQLLPREDVAVVIWGHKVTNDVSNPIRFHASKEIARGLLPRTLKWPHDRFDEVDWEHLDLALSSTSDMYKLWRSKQHTGYCGTRVQVGKYSGLDQPDERCPSCGRRESAAHILVCPDEDRTRLLAETTEDLCNWLNQEHLTDLELAYWIPKYILMRGDKPFASLGTMSPRMRALAVSQDKIGWRNFMEGCISTHFYFIQHYHLSLSGSYLNGSDWTKTLITKLLHISHSQWIYRNFALHDRLCGYLHNKSLEDIRGTIDELAETSPEDVPEESRFLLEINFGNLTKSHIESQQYWIIATQAAITAGQRSRAAGRRASRIRRKVNHKIPSRTKLGITAVERQIRQDGMHTNAPDDITFQIPLPTITTFLTKRPHPANMVAHYRSNKRLCKPD